MAHIPVLIDEVLTGLNMREGGKFIDATIGGGGHARAILERIGSRGQLLGLDRDPHAIDALASGELGRDRRVRLVHDSYLDIVSHAKAAGCIPADGILFDLGFSSMQIDDPVRGLSFRADGPLDMRFDPCHTETTAAAIVNSASESELVAILRDFGEEPRARFIAKAIINARRIARIIGTQQLADIIHAVTGSAHGSIDSATRTFQALRIAVNDELEILRQTLPLAIDLLAPNGRIAVISFHSLEDRIVKEVFRDAARTGALTLVKKKPISPSQKESLSNPRARSARLRVAIKTP